MDAQRLKRLSANHDVTIGEAFSRFLGTPLARELTKSEKEARERDHGRR
jgi:hypothetical protein